MALDIYPSGTQLLRIPETIGLPAANTPFNPDAFKIGTAATFDAVKALEEYGMFNSDFYMAQPPYPTSGGPYLNSGTYYFSGGIILAGATSIALNSARSYTRVIAREPSRNDSSWWSFGEQELTTPRPAYKQRYSPLAPVAPWLSWLVRIPGGTTLTSVTVRLDPADGAHGGLLPAEQPILTIWKYTASTGLMTAITSVQDNQPTIAAYEAPHDLALSSLSYSLWGDDDALVIGVRGEEGLNAVAAINYVDGALVVYHPRITFTRVKVGEE